MAAPPTKRPRSSSTAAAEAAKEKSWFPTFAYVPEPKVVQKPVRCCNECGREGHALRNCTRTSDHGDLMGCPWCDTALHLPEACPRYTGNLLGAEEIYEGIVLARVGKCQWRTLNWKLTFPYLVRKRQQAKLFGLPSMFYPHSREFALQQRALDPDAWRSHDYSQEPFNLVPDPRTDCLEKVLADDSLIDTFVQPSDRARRAAQAAQHVKQAQEFPNS